MPLYEYTCPTCRHDFETLIRGKEMPRCPQCGGARLEKRFSVPAAHTSSSATLPICQPGPRMPCGMGSCGLPECGS